MAGALRLPGIVLQCVGQSFSDLDCRAGLEPWPTVRCAQEEPVSFCGSIEPVPHPLQYDVRSIPNAFGLALRRFNQS